MRFRTFAMGAFIGLLLTAPLTAVLYLGDQLAGLPFAPFDLFNWMAMLLPGPLITFGIDLMIDTLLAMGIDVADTAKLAEQGMAVGLFLLSGVLAGAVFFLILVWRKVKPDNLLSIGLGALYGLPIAAISIGFGSGAAQPLVGFVWLLALFAAWGLALGWIYRRLYPAASAAAQVEVAAEAEAGEVRRVQAMNRRQFLIALGGSAAVITVIGAGVGALLGDGGEEQAAAGQEAHQGEPPLGDSFPNAGDPVVPAPGTRPEYTPLKDHYKVFIELEPTQIDGSSWVLPITGMVANPLMLTLDDLRNNYERRDQYVTLKCISGRVGTTLIGTTLWSGAGLQEILADAQIEPEARYLVITSGDGYYETVELELIDRDERIMLCYEWDGNPLPVDHGFPLRIWIPDRYGMKQPKWITGMEVTDTYREGFWVERGWDEVARVRTTSVIDTVALDAIREQDGQRLVPVGGMAYSGARGISRVDVRVDGGEWQEAQLRSPLSETTWVIWRFEWPFQEGSHTFEVRCFEGDGTPQILEPSDNRPSGATGIHSRSI